MTRDAQPQHGFPSAIDPQSFAKLYNTQAVAGPVLAVAANSLMLGRIWHGAHRHLQRATDTREQPLWAGVSSRPVQSDWVRNPFQIFMKIYPLQALGG
jgi:hypothetical protein